MRLGSSLQTLSFIAGCYYTECRLGEALEVTPERIDYSQRGVIVRTFKQKTYKPDKYRLVELPQEYLEGLNDLRLKSKQGTARGRERIWSFTDRTGQNYIKKIMNTASMAR